MRALIGKELREHLWLFVAALFIVCGGYLRSMYALLPAQAWLHVTRRSFLMVTSIGGGGFMLALGFRQMHGELSRGSWSFLVHRPVSSHRIWLSKFVAALIMFVGAVVVPTASVALWCAWPGNVAGPFVPSMLLPSGIDLVCALPYYFAGCVVGLWRAPLTISRGLALAVPLFTSLVAHNVKDARWALVVAVAATLWLGWLARGLFVRFARRAPTDWAVLATTLWFGLCAAHLMLGAFAPMPLGDVSDSTDRRRDEWFVSREGDVRRAVKLNGSVEKVFAADGKQIADLSGGDTWLGELAAPVAEVRGQQRSPLSSEHHDYRAVVGIERLAQTVGNYPSEWYFDHSAQKFVGFDRRTRLHLGSLGPDGLSKDQNARGFSGLALGDFNTTHERVAFGSGLFKVDWLRAKVTHISMPSAVPWASAFKIRSSKVHALASTTHVQLFEGNESVAVIPLDQQIRAEYHRVGIVEATNEYFVEYPHANDAPRSGRDPGRTIVFYSTDGRELRRWSRPIAAPVAPRSAVAYFHPLARVPKSPPAVTWFEMVMYGQGSRSKYVHGPAPQWSVKHAGLALLIGVLSALLSLLLSRGHTRRLRLLMAALCVLGGPFAAVLPFLLPKEAGVACPSCGTTRRVDAAPCGSCEAILNGYAQSDTHLIDAGYQPSAEAA